MYFADEGPSNAQDPVLNIIEPAVRRETLLARREERDGQAVYVFDIHLQRRSRDSVLRRLEFFR